MPTADISIVSKLPYLAEYLTSSSGGIYNVDAQELTWNLGSIPPTSVRLMSFRETMAWGIPEGSSVEHSVYAPLERTEVPVDSNVTVSYEILEESEDSLVIEATFSSNTDSGSVHLALSVTDVPEEAEPLLNATEIPGGLEYRWEFTVEGHSTDVIKAAFETSRDASDITDRWVEVRDARVAQGEHQRFLDWLRDEGLIGQETHSTYTFWNGFRTRIPVIRWLVSRVPRFGWIEGWFPKGTPFGSSYANSMLWAEILPSLQFKWYSGEIPFEADTLDKLYMFWKREISCGTGDCVHDASWAASTITTARDPNIKHGPAESIQPGQTLEYEIEYENEGEGIAFGVYITDILDDDLDETSLTIEDGGSYDVSTRTVTWMVGRVDPGQTGTVIFSINLRSNALPGTEVINYATVYFPSVPEITRTNGVVCRVPVNEPPIADAGPDQTVECSSCEGAQVILDGSGSSDPDNDPLTFAWCENGHIIAGPIADPISTVVLACGTHNVGLTVDDGQGEKDTDEVLINVVDTTPPVITVTLNRDVLWPPSHKLADIMAHVEVRDICDPAPTFVLVAITSDEPDNGHGDGDTPGDVQGADFGTPDLAFQLRSERSGGGGGRIYTITYLGLDHSGNSTPVEVYVRVPHDQSGMALAAQGYSSDGTCFDPVSERFAVVIPSSEAGALDATGIDPARAYIGNLKGVLVAQDHLELDATDDGLRDLVLWYSLVDAQWLFGSTVMSAENAWLRVAFDPEAPGAPVDLGDPRAPYGPVGLHYVCADGIDYLVPNIFQLGVPLQLEGAVNASGVDDRPIQGTALLPIRPNPLRQTTIIAFNLAAPGSVNLDIYNVRGMLVRTLEDGVLTAGEHSSAWDARDSVGRPVAAGIYFARFRAGGIQTMQKMLLVR
ncbi:MAG: FlgD immunoglobulin-like domain containing protein [Candidatus Eisenbacteria bacterium]